MAEISNDVLYQILQSMEERLASLDGKVEGLKAEAFALRRHLSATRRELEALYLKVSAPDERLRWARLCQFFGAYFHQDWPVEGRDWMAILDGRVEREGTGWVQNAIDDLRWWVSESLPGQQLPDVFGSYYLPHLEGGDDRRWVAEMADYLADRQDSEPPR